MQCKPRKLFILFVLMLILLSLACATVQPPTLTSTPNPTATIPSIATNTPRPSPTLRPTKTPNLAATQHVEKLDAEVQAYYDKGYLLTSEGEFTELQDFREECVRLGSYCWWLLDEVAEDFYMGAHFKWSSAYRSADISGCGFAFAIHENDQYAVFLDKSQVYFVLADRYYRPFKPTRGTGRVSFGNPGAQPVEADFALAVKDTTAYVMVDEELVGEYTLAQSRNLRGQLGVAILSGTNKDFGTSCEMTNLHLWIPAN